MNRSAKKQQHEQARKKHRHDAQAHAREVARRKPSTVAAWVLGVGITLIVLGIAIATAF